MGYGKNLKQILDEKHMTVKELSRRAGISAPTLYSIIQRDSSVRYDHALRIANILNINLDLICKDNPMRDDETLPELLPQAGGLLTDVNKRSYLKNRTADIFMLYDYEDLPAVDKLLADFFSLTDQGRKDVFELINFIKKKETDTNRKNKLKRI